MLTTRIPDQQSRFDNCVSVRQVNSICSPGPVFCGAVSVWNRLEMNAFELREPKKRRRTTIVGRNFQRNSDHRNPKKLAVENVKRNLSILTEIRNVGRRGKFIDSRLGERMGGLTETQKAAKRMQTLRVRQMNREKKRSFALSNLDEGANDEELNMTHDGTAIAELLFGNKLEQGVFDDSDMIGVDDEEDRNLIPVETHFGGGGNNTKNTKTRKEIYDEIIAKSKAGRAKKAAAKSEQEEKLEELDSAFQDVRVALNYKKSKWSAEDTKPGDSSVDYYDREYDKLTMKLGFDRATCPTDRFKSAAELAHNRAAKLEAFEKARLQLESELALKQQADQGEETNSDEMEDANEDDENEEEDDDSNDSESDEETGEAKDLMETGDDQDEEMERTEDETGNITEGMNRVDEDTSSANDKRSTEESENEGEDDNHDDYDDNDDNHDNDDNDDNNDNNDNNDNDDNNDNNDNRDIEDNNDNNDNRDIEDNNDNDDNRYIEDPFHNEFSPSWTINEGQDENHLPFTIPFPNSLEEFKKIFSPEKPKSQWKLFHRLLVSVDPSMNPDNKIKRRQLLTTLLEYLEDSLVMEFNKSNFNKTSNLRYDGFQLIEQMYDHLVDLGQRNNLDIIRDFFVSRLIKTCLRVHPSSASELQKIKSFSDWNENQKLNNQDLNNQDSPVDSFLPSSNELAMVFMISTVFSRTGEMFVTPTLLLLDGWASNLCQSNSASYHPISRQSIRQSDLVVNKSNQLPKVHVNHVRTGFSIVGLLLIFIESGRFYSSSILPLICGLLDAVVCAPDSFMNIETKQNLILELSESIRTVFSIVKSVTGLDYYDTLVLNVILPSTSSLLSSTISSDEIRLLILSLHNELVNFVDRPLLPLHLAPAKTRGIKMLTPQYVDPRSLSGARFLRTRGATEEQIESKKLRKELREARRGAGRQLHRDAEFVASVQRKEKIKRDQKLDQGYKRFLSILAKDQNVIHELKTSGGGMDTSLKKYAAKKKLKKLNNKRK